MASRRIALHARDLDILERLAESKVETLNVLHDRHWPDAARKTAYNRLNALAKAGYLEHVTRAEPREQPRPTAGRPRTEHLYVLGPKASIALRLRQREAHKLARARLRSGTPDALIDHQLATNRVGDWLGARLIADDPPTGADRRRRADAHYRAQPDAQGRDVVLVEVDLGHYSRRRILAKVQGFLEHPDARSIVFATPTAQRADQIAAWAREAYGDEAMARLQVFAFGELQAGVRLNTGTEPARHLPADSGSAAWYRAMMGPAGSD